MNYLTLENVTKSYGPKTLFKNISLNINRGDRIALFAKNGTGKTTLLRVLAGEEGSEGEQAKIIFAKDIRVGYLEQEPSLPETGSALDAIFASENPQIQAIKNYESALSKDDPLSIQASLEELETLQAWDFEAKIHDILSKLKIDQYLNQNIKTLSGGQRKRVALAKMLIDEPDFLILDEPTNHLDLDMIEWLEAYFMANPSLTLFIVTHDRYFLDAVCNAILELEGGTFYRSRGNYAYFLEQKALRQEVDAATLDKNRKLYTRELDWMRRTPAARTGKAQARIDGFYEIKDKISGKREADDMSIDIKTSWLGSKIVEMHNVGVTFNNRNLFENFDYNFKRGERVGIVGANGAGKSTFLRLLTEELAPTSGKVVVGDTIVFGYYTQDGMIMKQDKRVIEVITDIAEYIPLEKGQKLTAAGLLERFLFSRDQQQVYVSQLSGGEKRRLYLLTIIMKNPNFLILDEPTNDLDIVTLNVLEEFLQTQFNGCLVIVTHDRYFMDKLVDHLFIFEGNGTILDHNGNYTEYRLDAKERERAQNRADKAGKADKIAEKAVNTEGVIQTKRATDNERKEFKRLEKEVEKLENRKTEITNQFNDSSKLSSKEIEKLGLELGEVQNQLEIKELRWLELSEMV